MEINNMEYKFTEQELIELLETACGLQKAFDYQIAADELVIKESEKSITNLLDILCDTNKNIISDNTYNIEEIIELKK
jgi:hypothetical protein